MLLAKGVLVTFFTISRELTMNLFNGMVAVVALSAATPALSEESSANADIRQLIALASTNVPTAAAVEQLRFEDLVGSYEIDGASAFLIATDGDELCIEFSEYFGTESPRLRADVNGDFFVAEVAVLVTFDRDAGGNVVGATIHPSNAESSVSAVRTSLPRGNVTVYDVTPRRGIVSVYDVSNDVDDVTIAAAF
jgi:uncharacterized protein DUF3471